MTHQAQIIALTDRRAEAPAGKSGRSCSGCDWLDQRDLEGDDATGCAWCWRLKGYRAAAEAACPQFEAA